MVASFRFLVLLPRLSELTSLVPAPLPLAAYRLLEPFVFPVAGVRFEDRCVSIGVTLGARLDELGGCEPDCGVRLALPDPGGFSGEFERPGIARSKPEFRSCLAL